MQRAAWRSPFRGPGAVAPDRLLGDAELGEVGCAKMRLVGAEELVELRRLHARARKHRVHLAAMVDLVLEKVREDAIAAVERHAVAPRHAHGSFQPRAVE